MRFVSPVLKRVVYPALSRIGYLHRHARRAPLTVVTYHGVLSFGYPVTDPQLGRLLGQARSVPPAAALVALALQRSRPGASSVVVQGQNGVTSAGRSSDVRRRLGERDYGHATHPAGAGTSLSFLRDFTFGRAGGLHAMVRSTLFDLEGSSGRTVGRHILWSAGEDPPQIGRAHV